MAIMPTFAQKIVETQYFKNNPDLGGDIVINSSTKEAIGDKTYIKFEINASQTGSYNFNAWLMATKLSDGSYSSYDVLVNGSNIEGRIVPTRGDWQSIGLTKGKVILHAGINTVSIVGIAPEIPEIEFIRLSTSNAEISSEEYDNYINQLKEENIQDSNKTGISMSSSNPLGPTDPGPVGPIYPPFLRDSLFAFTQVPKYRTATFNFGYHLNVKVQYTYYRTISFTAGQEIFISTTGVNNFGHYLELFSSFEPENYSWAAESNTNCMATLNVTIPKTGTYYVRVRSNKNGKAGLCNLSINGQYYYENIPLYSMGIRCTQDNERVYNTFTCHTTTDPRIWIEEGTTLPGKIVAYNDDYDGSGDFYWGRNSRIKKQYPRAVNAVQVTAYSANSPIGNCDLYAKCMNSTIMPYFPNLKADDAIQSAPMSGDYNCISWSAGIWDYWEWPDNEFSDYYVAGDPLASFDNFYGSERYPGCSKFTRSGATADNSVIDLWAKVSGTKRSYTHGSVNCGADDNPHGFAWESKPGALARTFHPRYALQGDSYGQVVEYYRCSYKGKGLTYPLLWAIAHGDAILTHITFGDLEKQVIELEKANMSQSEINNFNAKYSAWKTVWENSPLSNPAEIKKDPAYVALLNYCKSIPTTQYLVFDKLGEGDIMTMELVKDMTLIGNVRNNAILNNIKVSNSLVETDPSGAKIVRSPYSNAMLYVKELLSGGGSSHAPSRSIDGNGGTTGITYSNTDQFNVCNVENEITISFELNNDAEVSIVIYDLSGNIISCPLANQKIGAGNYEYSAIIPQSGIYLVKYVMNGNINARKVTIM